MKLVADSRGRIACTVLFKPGAVYDAKREANGRIVLELIPADVPTVKPRRVKRGLRGANISLNPATTAAAVRADRNSWNSNTE